MRIAVLIMIAHPVLLVKGNERFADIFPDSLFMGWTCPVWKWYDRPAMKGADAMDMTKMGAFLQELRREKGMTQEQLGEMLHISSKTISRWETGTYMPPVDILTELSNLYGLTINELVADERPNPEALPQAAAESLTVALREKAAFPLQERKDYWQQKWMNDHRWAWIVLIAVHCIAQIAALPLDMVWVHAAIAIVAIGAAIFLRNRRSDYIEHHLYDEMLDK